MEKNSTLTTIVVACIGAVAGLGAAYLGYNLGQKQVELERSKIIAEFIVKQGNSDTQFFCSALERMCVSTLLRDEANRLRTYACKVPCPAMPN